MSLGLPNAVVFQEVFNRVWEWFVVLQQPPAYEEGNGNSRIRYHMHDETGCVRQCAIGAILVGPELPALGHYFEEDVAVAHDLVYHLDTTNFAGQPEHRTVYFAREVVEQLGIADLGHPATGCDWAGSEAADRLSFLWHLQADHDALAGEHYNDPEAFTEAMREMLTEYAADHGLRIP
jgi:hypothetical protein